MDYHETKMKEAIREGICDAILEANKDLILKSGNPHRTAEMVESVQQILNKHTDLIYLKIKTI